MRHLTLFVLMILCLRASTVIGQNHYNVDIFDFAKAKDPNTLPLPSPANLLANSIVEQVLELKPQSVSVRSPKDAGTMLVKNTFYKWEDISNPNAGMFVQLMTNPVYDEFEDYNSLVVDSKLTKGEEAPGLSKATPFKSLKIGKLTVAYSVETSRIYWNVGNNYVLMLAFNILNFDEAKLVKSAQIFIPEINKNLLAMMLE